MGKRSGGTRTINSSNSSFTRKRIFDFSMGEGQWKSIVEPGTGIGLERLEKYAIRLGASKESLGKALRLIDNHAA